MRADIFVSKLDASGSSLVYSTYLGGSSIDGLPGVQNSDGGIALDSAGNTYVAGLTSSTNFPTTEGSYQTTFGGSIFDAFVAKFNPSGTELLYATYLGGFGEEIGSSIAVDDSGNAYITGLTRSLDFPTTPGAFDVSPNFSHGQPWPCYYRPQA